MIARMIVPFFRDYIDYVDRNAKAAAETIAESATANDSIPEAAFAEIRVVLQEIKTQLPAISVSNAVKSEIHADIAQIEAETERPTPRRRFIRTFLESLRDNLAKAAATVLVAAVGAILAKFFGVF